MSEVRHEPVLTAEVAELLGGGTSQWLCDATVGHFGHGALLLAQAAPQARLLGLDRDPAALAVAAAAAAPWGDRVTLRQADFADLEALATEYTPHGFDRILLDLGLNTAQLTGERFSFHGTGLLDQRLDPQQGESGAELLARLSEGEIADLLFNYGDERYSRRIARRVVEGRRPGHLLTTAEFVDLVRRSYPPAARHGRLHVATRALQAVRVAVNRLLDSLAAALQALPLALAPGGRVGIISFQSHEDRMVKLAFRECGTSGWGTLVTRRPVTAGAAEVAANPQARSAKLRVLEAAAPALEGGNGVH
ncbi:MAG: 16S rRNA (cytosine(1402)-N(4))-methyltransferase RsmH [Fimbriimonadaceae bacterium]|nr:16S rRNA (cytosine(1402)-N(4))-methyltransferase RsmH [Fimbriimonadaceae bacterium]